MNDGRGVNLKQNTELKRSLSRKTGTAILMISLILSLAAITFGFYLYSRSVNREYRNKTWAVSQTAAAVLNMDHLKEDAEYVVSVYDSMSEEERLENDTEEYLEQFSSIQDSYFDKLRSDLYSVQEKNGAIAGYVAALDLENNRMLFITDGDPSETFLPPGHWDEIEPQILNAFVNGAHVNFLDAMYGQESIPSVVSRMQQYGYRCTAGTELFKIGDYPVFVFYDTDMNHCVSVSRIFLAQYVLLLLIVAVIVGYLMLRRLRTNVVNPINELTEAAAQYSMDRTNHSRRKRHFSALDITTGDEIEKLSETMKTMENDLEAYTNSLAKVTAEKERINTELDIARTIQTGMIPNIFPAFPERPEFDIYATMEPAKEVGGDFYDFFLIDDDHLGMIIADVSGKGIPAALFMMASKILIGNIAKLGNLSTSDILSRVNNQICENNSAEMFVTTWLGILNIRTGTLKASNAGHEYPILKRRNGKFELMKDKHGFVVGGMADTVYKEYEINLEPGDILLQYTDGVTEANNPEMELFGTNRLIDTLNRREYSSSLEVVDSVRDGVRAFAGGAEQADDITMLCLTYNGSGPDEREMKEIRINADIENLTEVMDFVHEEIEAFDCSMKSTMQIDIAVEEIFTNISKYAYGDSTGEVTVRVDTKRDPDEVTITFEDEGTPYNPLTNADPDITLSAEEREIGGLGIFMVKKSVDEIKYEYRDSKNILILKKILK